MPSLMPYRKPAGLMVAKTTDRRERENRASNRAPEFIAGMSAIVTPEENPGHSGGRKRLIK